MRLQALPNLVLSAVKKWSADNAARLGAALSYYTIFAMPPLFVILIWVASLCLDEKTVQTDLYNQIGGVLGTKAADAIQSALTATHAHQKGLLAGSIAIVGLVLTATGLFLELQGALNAIWGVREKPGQGIKGFVRNRLTSFSLVIGIGLLLILSVVVSTVIAAASKHMSNVAPGLEVIWNLGNVVVSLLVITVLFAMLFKVLPDVKFAWRDVWVGASITALLFTLGKFGLGFYLGKNSSVSAYGAAGSVVLVLLWVYYSAQILFFGAELTQVYANRFGTRLEPKAHAEWVTRPAERAVAARGKELPAVSSKKRASQISKLREEAAMLDELVRSKRRQHA
jgi:membrane protein